MKFAQGCMVRDCSTPQVRCMKASLSSREILIRGSEMQRVDADRRRGRPRTSSAGTQSSSRYVGATPLTHFYAITVDLKVTRRRTGSQ